MFIVWFS